MKRQKINTNPRCVTGVCLRELVCGLCGASRMPRDELAAWNSFGYEEKQAKARDRNKEERAGERNERGKKKGTRHNNIHKGRAGSAKCGQQSLRLCDADSPDFMPTFQEGSKSSLWHHFSLHSFQLFLLLRSPCFTNNTLEWRAIVLLTHRRPPR